MPELIPEATSELTPEPTPALVSPLSRKVAAAGIELAATCCGSETAKRTVFLLAPFPLDAWTWRRMLPELAKRGYRAIALDLRGLGHSDLQPGEVDLPRLATEVEGAIRSLGSPRFVVVGSGIGGTVAWTLAHRHMERLAAIVTVNAPHPPISYKVPAASPKRRLLPRSITARRLQDPQFVSDLILGSSLDSPATSAVHPQPVHSQGSAHPLREVAAHYQHAFARPTAAKAAYETFRAITHLSLADRKLLTTQITIPVNSIRTTGNPYIPGKAFADDADFAPHLKVHTLPNCGHYPQEEQPAAFNRLLLEILDTMFQSSGF